MINKSSRRNRKKIIDHDRLKEMVNNEDEFENFKQFMEANHTSPDAFKMVMDVIRESRIDHLFEGFGIGEEDLKEIKKKIIKITPKSKELSLKSTLYRKHNGKYKVETLLNQYHDRILKEGYHIGYGYGRKFLVKDIQNGRFTEEDIKNMSREEVMEYGDEVRDDI